ncbi:unnamed protein product, partial [Owenia fusiformis]
FKMATKDQTEKFNKDGYCVVENALSSDECDALRQECHDMIEEMDPKEHHTVFVATGDDSESPQMKEDYFMTSGDKIRFFFEKGALDEKGELMVDKQKSLNKIGHALYWLAPGFKKCTFSDTIKTILKNLQYEDPAVCQSMYIFKQPRIGGEVSPHQDASYLYTTPLKVMGIWIALEDATLDNGCLWFIPGSHKDGIHENRRMVRTPDGQGSKYIGGASREYDSKEFVPVPIKKGDLILIDGLVVHKSHANTSENSRHIYTFHVIEQKNTEWSKENWLQPTKELPFPSIYAN